MAVAVVNRLVACIIAHVRRELSTVVLVTTTEGVRRRYIVAMIILDRPAFFFLL